MEQETIGEMVNFAKTDVISFGMPTQRLREWLIESEKNLFHNQCEINKLKIKSCHVLQYSVELIVNYVILSASLKLRRDLCLVLSR